MRVFISYRRDDSMVTAALLYRELASRPEFADAFMDIDDIGYGDDFIAAIDGALHDADVVVVVIGPRWTEMLQARLRGDDWVRHEVATALRLRDAAVRPAKPPLRVLPVLIGGASPPPENALPPDLAPLARLGMLKFDERALKASVNTLLEAVQEENFEGKVRRLEEEQRRLEEKRRLVEDERRRRIRARVGSVAAAFVLFFVAWVAGFDVLGLDLHVARATMLLARIGAAEPEWSGDVVLVAIDETSERAIGRRFDASWRAEHAALIDRAAAAGARTVAFDMVLEDPGVEAANAALQRALAQAAREKMPVVFGVQSPGDDGGGAVLAPFAQLVQKGIACAGLDVNRADAMPLAVRRAGGAASAASAAGTGEAGTRSIPAFASFGLAAYSGTGRASLVDERQQSVTVRLRSLRRTEEIRYYRARTIASQSGCEVLQRGDRVFLQLLDPYALPALRTAPQRVAYERVVGGDPDALALLRDRIVLVGVLLPGKDAFPLPWPAAERWGAELFAAQVDAMARKAIRPIHPIAELALLLAAALLGASVGARLRERPRALRIAALAAIALVWVAAAVAWYRFERQLIGVPYDLVALAAGAWLANRTWRRPSA